MELVGSVLYFGLVLGGALGAIVLLLMFLVFVAVKADERHHDGNWPH